jgi:hypothetical protein
MGWEARSKLSVQGGVVANAVRLKIKKIPENNTILKLVYADVD